MDDLASLKQQITSSMHALVTNILRHERQACAKIAQDRAAELRKNGSPEAATVVDDIANTMLARADL